VDQAIASPLAAWENFYVIVGSSAGALTGLQFVVIAIIADLENRSATPLTIAAFGTPTILHFCAVLLVAALISAPWPGLTGPAVSLTLSGIAGIVYSAIVIRRARRQTEYRPVLEDWIWHSVLPMLAYGILIASGVLLSRQTQISLALVGVASLLLVFVGIHNAWDAVIFITIDRPRQRPETEKPKNPR
jgi:hypothetical protein